MRTCSAILAAALAAAPALAAGQAHRHGAATLQVTLEARVLQIGYEGPAENMLGFEHAPQNDAQKKTVARVEEQLRQPDRLFALPPAAECRARPPKVELKLPPPGGKEAHSEIEAEWAWECARPDALTHVDVGLFKTFSRLKQLRVQLVTPRGQTKAVLAPGAARLRLAA